MGSGGGNTVTRTLIPVLLTLMILGILFLLYFLKYIPGRQSALNDRAFTELQQIAKAARERDNGYGFAINTFLTTPQTSNPLFRNFKWSPRVPNKKDTPLDLRPSKLIPDSLSSGNWLLAYPLIQRARKDSFLMTIRLDSLLAPTILTYRDVFETYLLISPGHSEVLFSSDNLPLSDGFDPDSLLKKNEFTDPLYMHEVNLAGTPYKIFIYTLQIGSTPLQLAGLVSVSRYNAGYKDIPLEFFVPAGIIILLLVICLPILKIFILGPGETIVDLNIRQLIGCYFVAAFTCFLLFSWLFLNWYQSADNKKMLGQLTRQIDRQFAGEIDTICLQLKNWDLRYQTVRDSAMLKASLESNDIVNSTDSTTLDRLFRPDVYPYSDYVFWLDSSGKWTATWSEKIKSNKPPLLDARNREYFRDFINGRYLSLHDSMPFTIQSLLSRQDGEYRINVVIRSSNTIRGSPKIPGRSMPAFIGLSAKMHSVMNTVLPAGYNFSIIDEYGNIQYDSRPGRALLSNILKESEDPSSLLGSLRFRTRQYYSHYQLKGRDVALEVAPIARMPYTLVTYADLSDTDHFQIHVVGLTAFLTVSIVILLIISTAINEWTKKKPGILLAPARHFEWLRPLPQKGSYYRHLIFGMAFLFALYFLIWVVISLFLQAHEFTLFFITLSFPLYVALFYFTLWRKEHDHRISAPLSRPLTYYFSLLIGLLIISSFFECPSWGTPLLFIAAQVLFFIAYRWLVNRYMAHSSVTQTISWLRLYAIAIVTGVFMISIIPAWGLFLLFFKQETSLRHNSTRLEMAWMINLRRTRLNERMTGYKFTPVDSNDTEGTARLRKWKFRYGIYLLWGDSIYPVEAKKHMPYFPVAAQYGHLHNLFFPRDSNVLADMSPADWVEDGPWNFTREERNGHITTSLKYKHILDKVDPEELVLTAGPEESFSSIGMTNHTYLTIGPFRYILFDLAELLVIFLFYKLTIALAIRIFLIDMFRNGLRFSSRKEKYPSPPPCSDSSEDFEKLLAEIQTKENEIDESNAVRRAENILCIRAAYANLYEDKWKDLSPDKKFILFDLARDGFANYRTANLLFDLMRDRLILFTGGHRLQLITDSFREFVMQKSDDPQVIANLKRSRQKGQWSSFKTGLMILFAAFGIFIFLTQDSLFQKMTGLLTALLTLTTQFSTLFDRFGNKTPPENEPAGDKDT
jgi:hypothetical protein